MDTHSCGTDSALSQISANCMLTAQSYTKLQSQEQMIGPATSSLWLVTEMSHSFIFAANDLTTLSRGKGEQVTPTNLSQISEGKEKCMWVFFVYNS